MISGQCCARPRHAAAGQKYAPPVRRALVIAWIVSVGYYALRVTVFAMPDSCPDTVWESTDGPRCDWTYFDVAWVLSLPVLALATLALGVIAAIARIRSARGSDRSSR